MRQLREIADPIHKLSIRDQCDLLEIHRSGLYYKPVGESQENLKMMRLMDEHYLKHPTAGVLRMQDFLLALGMVVNHKRIRRLLRLMGIMAIYPKRNLSKLGQAKYIRPYLLGGLSIARPNQVWAIDITYIPMANGFMYLTAIIDLYSRYIVGWGLSNTLEAECSLSVLKQAIDEHGKPEIINSDQGSQFTCEDWVTYLKVEEINISMDGKGRAIDNIFIERFWRSLKYDHVYLFPANDGLDLYKGLEGYFYYYNNELAHQGIGRQVPAKLYKKAA
ncbi:MAG: IS3 family transposase [Bacteroidales bacterium]|nr:IS3 family transposase [Bacteroidales bacterium]